MDNEILEVIFSREDLNPNTEEQSKLVHRILQGQSLIERLSPYSGTLDYTEEQQKNMSLAGEYELLIEIRMRKNNSNG